MAGSTPFRKRRARRSGVTTGPEGQVSGAPSGDAGGPAADEHGHAAPPATRAARGAEALRRGGRGARAGLTAIADRIIANAPRIPVRDLATLRAQFPGLGPEELADKLVAGALNGSSTVGAGVGATAMLPVPPALPAELAAQMIGVAAVEFKLIAELHEVYGVRASGTPRQRAVAYLGAWAEERGIDVTAPFTVNAALGGQLRRELRQQILRRSMRKLPTLAPFMIGAAVGAVMNRRDTQRLAAKVRKDLRTKQVPWEELPGPPPPKALDDGLGLA
ncbi:hypothetical protein GCM10010218_01030 [Streptomyces mashuensis]|uniref:EcsC family protein n=1 Tax=Streptomyces mashuensis TaxID=33904 RepID=A0A919ATC4_9ACTN|nr:hypothetical protein [Streptomyces mashuensis]GHF24340.1 hypothetical protein GCM10010218_01030 [Streptomyces mashuensis]